MKNDPIVKEAREAGQRLVDEAGGTLEGYFELLRRREKERKWPGFRWAAVRYIETNPVRAGMVARAEDYAASSARAHVRCDIDALLAPGRPFPDPARVGDWSAWLAEGADAPTLERLRLATRTGRPCGSPDFIRRLEALTDRILTPLKRGPKPKPDNPEGQLELWT